MDSGQVATAVSNVRTLGSVAIIGAGFSAARYPMTAQLTMLLWHALDEVPSSRERLADHLGIDDGPAKTLIGADAQVVEAAWEIVRTDDDVRRAFQTEFVRLDAEKEPTPAHFALARMIRAGHVQYIVSFNWDSALERAYERLFGVPLSANREVELVKPHGDVASPDQPWVLPHEGGRLSDSVSRRVRELSADHPRVLLVIGYSGSDELIVRELLEPLQQRWPVVRVGPSARGSEAITAGADEAMVALADALHAGFDVPGWRWVKFTPGRDIGAALMGSRLGPRDVDAVPPGAAVQRLVQVIGQTSLATVVGESGSGKSITAFQAASVMQRNGWAVLELAQPGVADAATVRTFEGTHGPVFAVVDDAQAIDAEVVAAFERSVSADHAVLLIRTVTDASQTSVGREAVRILPLQTVLLLRDFCVEQADTLAPLVSRLDDRVGDRVFDEPFRRRVDVAATAKSPWQFMFLLTGGERRLGQVVAELNEDGNLALLLGSVAALQNLTLDAGATLDDLVLAATQAGFEADWVSGGLAQLTAARLVVERGGRFRTVHLRIADQLLRLLCRTPEDANSAALIAYMRFRLADSAVSVRGKFWMLRAIDQVDQLRYGNPALLLPHDVTATIAEQCLAAEPGGNRNSAAYLLWECTWWRSLTDDHLAAIVPILQTWVNSVQSDDVFGIAWLLGGVRSTNEDTHRHIKERADPAELARALSEGFTVDNGESWAKLLYEVAPDHDNPAAAHWWGALDAHIDSSALVAQIEAADPVRVPLRPTVELAARLTWPAPITAAAVIQALTPILCARLETNVADVAGDLVPWIFNVFPLLQVGAESSLAQPHVELLASVRAIFTRTDWSNAGQSIVQSELRDLFNFDALTLTIASVDEHAARQLSRAMPVEHLERLMNGRWADLGDEAAGLLRALAVTPDAEPARSLMAAHVDEITFIPCFLVPVNPAVAAEVLRRGGVASLSPHSGLRWVDSAAALAALKTEDRDAALAAVSRSADQIRDGLLLAQANEVEDLDEFVSELDDLDLHLLENLLSELDVETVSTTWAARFAGNDDERAAARLLLDRARQTTSQLAELAETILTDRAKRL